MAQQVCCAQECNLGKIIQTKSNQWISNFMLRFFPIDISTLYGDKMAGTFPAVVAGSAILPGSAI